MLFAHTDTVVFARSMGGERAPPHKGYFKVGSSTNIGTTIAKGIAPEMR